MSADQELNLDDDLEPIVIDITCEGKQYKLKEANGDAIAKYQSARSACRVYNNDEFVGLKNVGDLEPLLISLCLFTHPGNQQVPTALIRSWPARKQRQLFQKAWEISDLADKSPEKEGLATALAQEGAPITMKALGQFIMTMEGKEFKEIKAWFKDVEELAKNGQKRMTVGSA